MLAEELANQRNHLKIALIETCPFIGRDDGHRKHRLIDIRVWWLTEPILGELRFSSKKDTN